MATPRLVVADVTIDGAQLKVVWRSDGRPTPAYFIDQTDIRETSTKIRNCLQLIVDRGMSGERQEYGDLLKELATHGRALYDGLFLPGGDGNQQDPIEIRDWLQGLPQPLLVEFNVDTRIHVPWGLVYDGDPATLTGASDADGIEQFRGFWCLKFGVSSVYSKVSPLSLGIGATSAVLKVLTVANRGVLEKALGYLAGSEHDKIRQWIAQNYGDPIYTSKEFFERWEAADVGMLFFYCHASGTSLALGADDMFTVSEFRRKTRRVAGTRNRSACMVFLNGCNTAVGDSGGGFLEATGGDGFCGFIGTEARVPDLFALRFGLAFLFQFLYEGQSVHEAIAGLREEHWPLGLTYSTYCHPLLQVDPQSLKLKSPLKMEKVRVNFSRLTPLGTQTMSARGSS